MSSNRIEAGVSFQVTFCVDPLNDALGYLDDLTQHLGPADLEIIDDTSSRLLYRESDHEIY